MKKYRPIILSSILVAVLVLSVSGLLYGNWLKNKGEMTTGIYSNNVHVAGKRISRSTDDPDFAYNDCVIEFSFDKEGTLSGKSPERVTVSIALDLDCAALYSAIFSDMDYMAIHTEIFIPNSDRDLIPRQADGSIDWGTIMSDPELAKRYSKITSIQAEG